MIEVRLHLLMGKAVRDAQGKVIGRIHSVVAERKGAECFVKEYRLGAEAWLKRLGIATVTLFGFPSRKQPRVIPWQKMDLSDPENPRLKE